MYFRHGQFGMPKGSRVLTLSPHSAGLDRRIARYFDLGLMLLALVAALALVAEYGFYLSPAWLLKVHAAGTAVLFGFALQGWGRLLLAYDKRQEIRTAPVSFALVLLVTLYQLVRLGIVMLLGIDPHVLLGGPLLQLFVVAPPLLLALTSIPPLLRGTRILLAEIQPVLLLIGGFVLLIGVGTLLLMVPRATPGGGISFLHALFTATSAACVTGLTVVDTGTCFSPLGQTIILVLMQLGGLGVMTMTTFVAFLSGGQRRLKEYTAMKDLLAEESLGRLRQTALAIALTTLLLEALGAVFLYHFLRGGGAVGDESLAFFCVFHAVSAFCNAGFSLCADNLAAPFLCTNTPFQLVVMVLVILGGLGFPVLTNLASVSAGLTARKSRARLTLHAKIVLLSSLLLIVGGAVGIFLLERHGALSALPSEQRTVAALFASVSARTAGFNTVPTGGLGVPTLVFLALLMWVGASPASTGGGIKTTTAVVAFLNLLAVLSGKNKVELFHRQIRNTAVVKAFSTVILSVLFIGLALFLLLLTEKHPMHALFFEIVSAVGTVGLSTGITSQLSAAGEVILIVAMFAGRVGLLALLSVLVPLRQETGYAYVEESVMIG
jgi:potassium uptake TrkH family protein